MAARIVKYEDTVAVRCPNLAKELISHDPHITHYGSREKASWECSICSYQWTNTLWLRTKKNTKCPQCYPRKLAIGVNDLATIYPYYAQEIISHNPSEIHCRSNSIVKWQCINCFYIWKSKLISRIIYETDCPQCSEKNFIQGVNDIATIAPEIIQEYSFKQ